jgi:exodeoxyribonuclease VII large subunit
MQLDNEITFGVSDFVAVCNQTLEFAYPAVSIEGELANFKVSKNRWVYFDLKDEDATVSFFGMVYNLPGPLEDGMILRVRGTPRLHPLYGFKVTVQLIQPVGEGSIKKAANLLQTKLAAEGLFSQDRKRQLPYPPERIGLIASTESAAYADFMKIINARWRGLEIISSNVQVQGEIASSQIVDAIEAFNHLSEPPEVLVITRGGGSAEDLQAFSTEQVTRAVAASRIPTLVAVGHEIDVSLAELAADVRGSTPSNAAELLTPDSTVVVAAILEEQSRLYQMAKRVIADAHAEVIHKNKNIAQSVERPLVQARQRLAADLKLLQAMNPRSILRRGYAIVRRDGSATASAAALKAGDIVDIEFNDGHRQAGIS